MPIKVCHITTVHQANDNRIFFKECTSLTDAGYEVVLLCANAISTERNGVQIIGFKGHRSRVKRFFLTSLFSAYNEALKINAALYHLHDPELVWTGLLLKLSGKKVIMDVHENNAAAILSRPYIKAAFTRKLLSGFIKLIEAITLPFFNGIVTARPDISDLFPKLNPVTVRNFPILPDYDQIPDISLDKEKKAIIYVGGATRIRGIIELIEAMDSVESAELWILGPFESQEFLQECKSMNGWRNVRYLGVVEADKIFPYIKAADVGIITFLPLPNHITTLATKPFEYMACGLPVIMSNFHYWKSFFGESAIYVDPSNSAEIAKAIDELMHDDQKLLELKKMNLQLAREEYNWQKEKEKLLNLYQKVLN
jgi:glycosyltransferase involved in cell wall biosynthesis